MIAGARREIGVALETAIVWGRFLGEELEFAVTSGVQTAIGVQREPVWDDFVTLHAYVPCGLRHLRPAPSWRLQSTDLMSRLGLLYDGDDSGDINSHELELRRLANILFTAINEGSDR